MPGQAVVNTGFGEGTSSGVSVSFNFQPTAGNTFVFLTTRVPGVTIISITDTAGNTWTINNSLTNITNSTGLAFAYVTNASVGIGTYTVTATFDPVPAIFAAFIVEIANANTTSFSSIIDDTSVVPSTSTSISVAATRDNDIILVSADNGTSNGQPVVISAPSNFTIISSTPLDTFGDTLAYGTVSTPQVVSVGLNSSISGGAIMISLGGDPTSIPEPTSPPEPQGFTGPGFITSTTQAGQKLVLWNRISSINSISNTANFAEFRTQVSSMQIKIPTISGLAFPIQNPGSLISTFGGV